MRVGIDLDLVTIASDEPFYHYLQCVCGGEWENIPFDVFINSMVYKEGSVNYDLSKYFPEPRDGKSDAFDFFRGTTSYDTIKPVVGAVRAIKEIQRKGYEIVFISHVKGHTLKGKHNWLLRHFPFDFGYIATKEKYLVNVDIMIDDRLENLVGFPATVKKILFSTPYKQTYNLVTRDQVIKYADDWEDVLRLIDE